MTTLVGRTLGRYRLESLLGRGGMAEVYRATDTRLARTVAVKVILDAHAEDRRFSDRFLREARVVASLEHPCILPVYDFGEEGGLPYLVMPFLDGGSLRDRMIGRPIPIDEALSWIRQLAEALDAAHAAGVLHRDVKPANVLIGKGGRLFLADFGIARMMESETSLTGTGAVLGTPIYMSPEQAQGQPATAASDRYALAVLAWEILTGHPPFRGESALALMNQHVTAPIPAISERLPGLPYGLDPVFARALSKRPDERPSTSREFAEQVALFHPAPPDALRDAGGPAPQAVLATRATSVIPPTDETRLLPGGSGPRPKHRPLAAAATVVVAAVVVTATILLSKRTSPPAEGPTPAGFAPPAAAPTTLPTPHASPPLAPTEAIRPSTVVELRPSAPAASLASADRPPTSVPAAARAAPPPPHPPPTAGPTESPDEAVAAARRRLETGSQRGGRLTREDFEFARRKGREAASARSDDAAKAPARAVEIYAQGGIDYLDGKDGAAGQALVDAFRLAPKAAVTDLRSLRFAFRGQEGAAGPPGGWELALAYGDARGEAEALLEEALHHHPNGVRPLLGRARLRQLQGRNDESLADGLLAWEKHPSGLGGHAVAEFLGETQARRKDYLEAVRWFRLAAVPSNPLTAHAAMSAATILRDQLDRPNEAAKLFNAACLAGNNKACDETHAPSLGPRRRRSN